jgi:hypothetical protein
MTDTKKRAMGRKRKRMRGWEWEEVKGGLDGVSDINMHKNLLYLYEMYTYEIIISCTGLETTAPA